MNRYGGEALPVNPRIAVLANDALGNYVVATPLLEVLRRDHPAAHITFATGPRTQELFESDQRIDDVIIALGSEAYNVPREGHFDWVINLEQSPWMKSLTALLAGPQGAVTGPCIDAEGRGDLAYENTAEGRLAADSDWASPHVTERHPILKSSFIGEIFARIAYIRGPIPNPQVSSEAPPMPIPSVLIATVASLESKLWTADGWQTLVRSLPPGIGLLGASPAAQSRYWRGEGAESKLLEMDSVVDLRGKLTLPQVVGAIQQAKLVVTLDNGIMHLAASTGTPTVALFRSGIAGLWAPPAECLHVLEAEPGATVAEIAPRRVIEEAICAMRESSF